VPIRNGAFTIAGIPAGTWAVDVKAIGYEPQSELLSVTEHVGPPVLFVVNTRAQTLEAVSVVRTPGRETQILDDIVTRRKVASGAMFMPGNSWLASDVQSAPFLWRKNDTCAVMAVRTWR
jgi:hypothetical protein